ncbi:MULTISPECIES: pyridoxal-phosphate dependent enzyme [unclassified Streptomyces]|uniref:pyridoxal-phosphate dependent enzyme n=1 Tax=unclassified Streptomyces TaxID=2593676 RepID=UPI0033BD8FAF
MTANDSGPITAPRVLLGTWPTPLEAAPRLAAHLGLGPEDLWLKRDDLSGLGGGGNKVRKLEFSCGQAVDRGATVLVASGGAQSNYARLTAAASSRLGLKAVLVLRGNGPQGRTGNLSLEGLLGARVVWAGDVDAAGLDRAVAETAAELTAQGERVEVLPFGGSDRNGALGYLEGGRELRGQLPDVEHVVVAGGSGGTMAGLVAALGADRVLGVDVGAVQDLGARVAALVGEVSDGAVGPSALRLRHDQVGDGYGVLTPAASSALEAAARSEGVILDPVYTAKAMAGLAAAVADGDIRPGRRTVFVHTGGLPGLFGHDIAAELAHRTA